MLLSYLTGRHVESAEDTALREMLYQHAMSAIALLKPEDQELVYAVVIGNVTEQDFADTIGVSQVAVHKRKKRILKKIAKLMVINPSNFWEGQ